MQSQWSSDVVEQGIVNESTQRSAAGPHQVDCRGRGTLGLVHVQRFERVVMIARKHT